ncbi:hypothetical protein C1H46_016666 [Malus baccata]|uniref:Glycosyl transferase family 1 domain-containing protein n=1 Tax=Malus baccata TaxID=106549 RepID=A0A540MG71_MALBA|nr:hypothetical protein C1H46_016666 [Malus baccata]
MAEKDGSAKGIVFSQFTSFLDISRHICIVSGADVQLHKKGGQECEWRHTTKCYCSVQYGLGETFGRVTIEAMAFGLPVLGTEAGGTKEIVEHNVTGLLHPVGHDGTRGLAENLRFLLKMCAIKAFHLTIDVEEL